MKTKRRRWVRAMKTRKTLALTLTIILLFLTSLFTITSFSFENEPDGFRGIKWGTNISTLRGMTYVATQKFPGGIKVYTRQGDNLEIGGANLESISYGFWGEKFLMAIATTKGFSNWQPLQKATFAKFGKGYQSNKYIESYFWNGPITIITLSYSEISRDGALTMISSELNNQVKQYQEQKAKEGAESGF